MSEVPSPDHFLAKFTQTQMCYNCRFHATRSVRLQILYTPSNMSFIQLTWSFCRYDVYYETNEIKLNWKVLGCNSAQSLKLFQVFKSLHYFKQDCVEFFISMSKVLVVRIEAIQDASLNVPSINYYQTPPCEKLWQKTKEIFQKFLFWFKNFEWLKKRMVIGCNRHLINDSGLWDPIKEQTF